MPVVKCKQCKDYIDRDTATRSGWYTFCSKEHRDEFTKERNGRSRLRQRATDRQMPPATRQGVYESDGWKCRFCNGTYLLHLHHIKYRSEGGTHDLSNLITLCATCHETVHSDKGLWQEILLEYVSLRESGANPTCTIPVYLDRVDEIGSAKQG